MAKITYKNGFELAIKVMYGEDFGLPPMLLDAWIEEYCRR